MSGKRVTVQLTCAQVEAIKAEMTRLLQSPSGTGTRGVLALKEVLLAGDLAKCGLTGTAARTAARTAAKTAGKSRKARRGERRNRKTRRNIKEHSSTKLHQ